MVCKRCIDTIHKTLSTAGFKLKSITLGKVIFNQELDLRLKDKIRTLISKLGFEILSNRNEVLLNNIKDSIEEWMSALEKGNRENKLSDHLVQKLNKSYDSLSEFFVQSEQLTIEKYFIEKRLDKVKEFLAYSSKSLSEIAFLTGFSSTHHLSNQFKKVIGLNPSELRQTTKKRHSKTL